MSDKSDRHDFEPEAPAPEVERQLRWIARHAVGLSLKFDGPREAPKKPAPSRRQKKKKERARSVNSEAAADEELDLHGMAIDQALFETEKFLESARTFGLSIVRIIHGQGPDQGPSLRTEVRRFLKKKCGRHVAAVLIEPHNDGAVVVELNGPA